MDLYFLKPRTFSSSSSIGLNRERFREVPFGLADQERQGSGSNRSD